MNNIKLKQNFEFIGQNYLMLLYSVKFIRFEANNQKYFYDFSTKNLPFVCIRIIFSKSKKDI